MKLIIALGDPTGEDVDDVNPESLLIETDRSLVMYLCVPKRERKRDTQTATALEVDSSKMKTTMKYAKLEESNHEV